MRLPLIRLGLVAVLAPSVACHADRQGTDDVSGGGSVMVPGAEGGTASLDAAAPGDGGATSEPDAAPMAADASDSSDAAGMTDECSPNARESRSCGRNLRGTETRACMNGSWSTWTSCSDGDICVDGAEESVACGLNGSGRATRRCVAGAWTPFEACVDSAVCSDGTKETSPCGLNGRGLTERTCTGGSWGAWSGCADMDVCQDSKDGEFDSRPCGMDGVQTRQCLVGQWTKFGPCSAPPDPCIKGIAGLKPCRDS